MSCFLTCVILLGIFLFYITGNFTVSVIISFILCCCVCLYYWVKSIEQEGEKASEEQEFYESLNLYPDKEFRFTATNKWTHSINLFNSYRKIVIANLTEKFVISLDYQNIVQCVVQQDNSTVTESSAGNALTGAILAGTTGAIIGAASHSTKDVCSLLSVRIITNNVLNPSIVISLINNQINRNSSEYQFLLGQANAIYATLTAIIHENNRMHAMSLNSGRNMRPNYSFGPPPHNNYPFQPLNSPTAIQPYHHPPMYNDYYDPNGPQYPYPGQ